MLVIVLVIVSQVAGRVFDYEQEHDHDRAERGSG